MKFCLFALSLLALGLVSDASPRPPQQLTTDDQAVLQEIFDNAKDGADKDEVLGRINSFFKRKMKMPMKEGKQKDGTRTMRFKKVRRVGPPFSEYLEGSQRQELLEVIKHARASGKSQHEVRETIDTYLQSHLNAEKLAQIEKVKAEGALQERERLERDERQITDREHQIVDRYLSEAQRDQLAGLLEMAHSQQASDAVVAESVDRYLQNVLNDATLSQLEEDIRTDRNRPNQISR